MTAPTTIPDFRGELIRPGDPTFDQRREVWNAMVDRRPALIARCTSAADVAAAVRHGREAGLEIAVKCGGHSMIGISVPEGGLMIDLGPMNAVTVDPDKRLARVQGGALLRNLDHAAEPYGLATTAGNVSHTGVGGLTLGGGMGWLARQFGLACDNVIAYTLVTADGQTVRASADEHPDLYWGLRGGGGNFGIVTEFEFRLHPFSHTVLMIDRYFEPADAPAALRAWRDLLADAPREATFTTDAWTPGPDPALPERFHGRPVVTMGFVWAGDVEAGRRYLETFRETGDAVLEEVTEQRYLELQSIGDESHRHGKRRYFKGHYLAELSDAALDALVGRGLARGAEPADWTHVPNGGLQAWGGAIAEIDGDASAFSHRAAVVDWYASVSWVDPAEDEARMSAARAYAATIEPFATGVYVNALSDEGDAGVRRAYDEAKLVRLAALKRRYDPHNVFHLNNNIKPAVG